MNDTTRRFPRSIQEAFGPHTSRTLGQARRRDRMQTLVYIAYAAAFLVAMWWAPTGSN